MALARTCAGCRADFQLLLFTLKSMKFNSTLIAGCLAFAGLAGSASAQVSPALSDLIIGFHASGGTGATTNLEVDLGSVGNLFSVGLNSTVTFSNLNVSDLIANYGAGWASRSDLTWGVIAADSAQNGILGPNNTPARTIWATSATTAGGSEITAAGTAAPWARQPGSTQQAGNAAVGTVYSGFSSGTVGANSSSITLATGNSQSWTSAKDTSTGVAFSVLNPNTQFEQTTNTGGGQVFADLYELRPGSSGNGTLLGSFALSNAGVLTYTSAIPEPSTYAALAGVCAMGLAIIRRRRTVKA